MGFGSGSLVLCYLKVCKSQNVKFMSFLNQFRGSFILPRLGTYNPLLWARSLFLRLRRFGVTTFVKGFLNSYQLEVYCDTHSIMTTTACPFSFISILYVPYSSHQGNRTNEIRSKFLRSFWHSLLDQQIELLDRSASLLHQFAHMYPGLELVFRFFLFRFLEGLSEEILKLLKLLLLLCIKLIPLSCTYQRIKGYQDHLGMILRPLYISIFRVQIRRNTSETS